MKQLSTRFIVFLAFVALSLSHSAKAQMVGDQIFLKGKWVEVGVAPNGALGSTRLPPAGVYHCSSPTFNFWDPGLGAFTGASNQRLMMVYDAGHDGFTTGTPAFFGDYSMPGSPYEGWGIQINGAHSEAQAQYYTASGATGFAGGAGLTGNTTAYLNPTGKTIGVWQGTAGTGGALQITQTTTLDTNASWVKMNVKFKNTSAATLVGVYYVRETDPDNDVMAGGPFTTSNTINHQNDYYHRVMVTGTGTFYTSQTLSLATKDCRAKCFIHSGWPSSTATNLATLYASGAGGYTFSGTITSDVAIGLIYNLGNIAAGDSTEINYSYIFNGLTGIDSAMANPQLVVNGIARDTTDTVTSCSFTGSSLACSIINGSTADWFGSTWTWAPSTYLATTTGLTNTISVSSITAPITYTITGTTGVTGCSGKTFLLTVMPPGSTPPPTTTTPLSYCLGSTAPALTASGIGTIYWWTTPTGGVGSTTAPTPSTSTVGTTTYYVSQVVAGCPSVRIPVTVTIFALSTPITGSLFVCTGFTTTLANATTGGIWTSGSPAIATIGSTTGLVTGVAPGTVTMSYTVLGCLALTTVTVTTTPAAITGLSTVCVGTSITLANSVPGGSWVCACPTIASVGSSTGVVTGITVGTCIMTYNMGGGCFTTKIISVNPFPSAITGAGTVCVGATTPLASSSTGGIWSSTLVTIASVGAVSGIVAGVNPGTVTIKYTVAGCAATKTMTVVSAATPIVGPTSVCAGSTITLTNPSTGGTWSMACPTIASVNPTTGVVTGINAGTCTVTYSLSAGCSTTTVITVTPTPTAITGNIPLCIGQTNTLTHGTPSGTWSMACPTVATVDLGTGLVTAVGAGTCVVTYTLPSGCIATAVITVNPLPSAITGTLALCQGATATLSSATAAGTWSSGTGTVASIDAATGLWTALTGGTSVITYTAPTSCITTATVTVDLAPSPITGPSAVCAGQTITLSSTTPGGGWSSSDVTVATISGTGDVFGVSTGTTIITYALPSGCYTSTTITVNATPSAISGPLAMCVGNCNTYTVTTTGGTWSSSTPTVGSLLSPGFFCGSAAGTATISYTIGATGCYSTLNVTVNTLPGTIGGTLSACVGACNTLTNPVAGGTWTSSTPAVATIDVATGLFCGVTSGTATMTYSLGTGCTTTAVVTVNALPGTIGATLSLCQGSTTTLTSTPSGGTWFSDNTATASIGIGTGVVTTGTPGTATISYTLATGCRRTAVFTVNGLPAVITGISSVCVGQCTTLNSTTAGGTWSSVSAAVGTINATTGIFCGTSAGTTTVSYTMPTGCARTTIMLVNALPTGITPSGAGLQVCEGSTLTLSGTPSGGTWSSACAGIGTIAAGSGTYGGVSAGTCTVTYTLATGCALVSSPITVNPLPGTITGALSVCVGQTTTVNCLPATGTWSISSGTGTATIGSSTGVVTGGTSGTATVTYTLPTGCRKTAIVTINALPGIITGAANVCASGTTTLNCTPSGGTWSITGSLATIGVTTGIVLAGSTAGTADVTYTAGAGCYSTRTITINSLPAAITGTPTTCVGQCTALASTTAGGAWSSSTPSIGSINTATTSLCGVSAGTTTVSYTLPTTCRVTQVVTVYALPSAIGGSLQVCEGATGTLTTTTPGGSWSVASTAIATVDAVTGSISGVLAGTTTATYTLGTGCSVYAVVTVNPAPAVITGVLQVCEGQTTTLSDATPSGTWSSSAAGIATVVSSTGLVTGIAAGTTTISYTVGTGCSRTAIVTVHALPSTITGPSPMWVCENATVTLSSSPAGGVWSSPSGSVAVNPVTGAVTGIAAGTATISYMFGIGCVRTATITVNPQPATITGNLNVCIGLTQTLATTSTGGTWTSSNTAVAPVDPTGVVSGAALGTANISYTLPVTGCIRSVQATVQPLPSTITGSAAFCNLSTTTYLSSPGGGTWSTSDTSIITIDPSTGVATGVSVDTADIIYTLPTGCTTSKRVFLILAPYPITGPQDMCLGQSRTLSNVISGGVWSSSSPFIADVVPSTGVVTGYNLGPATITYVLSTGCASTYGVTVNPIPVGVTGPNQLCESYTATYSNSTAGGTWSTSDTTIATINTTSGLLTAVSGGVVTVTYTLGSGCNAMKTITVNALPGVISAPLQVCEGSSIIATTSSTGGLWSTADPGVAIVTALTGNITGMSAMTPGLMGLGVTVVTYTLPTGCYRTENVTVNPLPDPNSGPTDVCVGDNAVYSNPTPGGGWVSSNPAVGTIDGVTGIFTAISAGNTIISYVLPTACVATTPVTVHDNPAPISGSLSVCAGFATNLTSSPTGGTWSQTPTSMPYGTINMITGVVSGITAGIIPITYTLGSGCRTMSDVTVITLPAVIGGAGNVCVNDSTILTHTTAGGTWSSSNAARATVDPLTGMVHGVSAGSVVITYSISTGCFNVRTLTVNALPTPITGPLQVCEGSTIVLGSTPTPGGVWISDTTAAATVGYLSGVVTGIAAGLTNISYVISATGCLTRVQVTVNVTPPTITGNPHICIGSSNTFSNAMAGGSWISSNPAIATIDAATGVATSVSLGVIRISYVLPVTGCMAVKVVSVDPLPNVYTVTGGGNYCSGATGVNIGLNNSQAGVSYELYRGTSATGYLPGTGFPLNFGLHTAGGVYTVQATDVTSGCQRNMSGSATVVVNPLVTPSVTIASAPYDSVCTGQSITLSPVPVNGGTTPTYLWKVNGVSVSTAGSYAFVPANGDIVTLTMTSNANCLATATATAVKTMAVLPNATPIAGVLTSPNDTICQFNPVTFTAAPTYGGGTPVYTWLVNGVAVGTGDTYSYIPVNGDIVNLRMTSDYRCRLVNTVTSGDVALSVDSVLIPNVTVWPEGGYTVTAGKPVTLHASATNAGATPKFQWKVNGYPVSGATNSSYTAVFNDYDSIGCVVTSSGVCNNIGTFDWLFITTTELGTQTTTGLPSDIRLVPNPNKGMFTIKGTMGTGNEEVTVDVTNMLGQVVYRGAATTQQGKLDTQVQLDNKLANGMYILTLRNGEEQKVFHFVMEQ
jgi:uncharacterized protein YjdB